MPRTIKVPRTPSSAYGPDRKPSALLKTHIDLLEAEGRKKGAKLRAGRPRKEALAARYITQLTEDLHPRADDAGVKPESKAGVDALMAGLRRPVRKTGRRAGTAKKAQRRARAAGRAKK